MIGVYCLQVLVRGTSYERTYQSAVAFMFGFEPSIDISRFDGVEMADNNTLCTSETGQSCNCRAIDHRVLDIFSTTFRQSYAVAGNPQSQRVAESLATVVSKLPRMSHVFDVAMTHFCHRQQVDACYGPQFARDVFNVIADVGRKAAVNSQYHILTQLKFLPLLYEIVQRMKLQRDSSLSTKRQDSPSFVLYSGHDSTIEPLAMALGFSSGAWPGYASRIVFELYQSKSTDSRHAEFFTRILYNGKVVTNQALFSKGATGSSSWEMVRLNSFVDFVEQRTFSYGTMKSASYSEACQQMFFEV